MKRQRGRNRGGGGNVSSGKQQHNVNRAFDSNGPDGVKIRGHAQHVFEKYQQLARDASGAGDRVLAENYLQHAEHYFRVLRAVQPQRPLAEIIGRDSFGSGYDIDFEDEGGANAAQAAESDQGEQNDGGYNDEQPRGEYRQDNGARQDNNNNNGNRQDYRQDGQREWRDRDQNRSRERDQPRQENRDQPRQDNRDQPRQDNQNRQDNPSRQDNPNRSEGRTYERDRPPRNRDRNREDRVEREPQPAIEAEPAPVAAAPAPEEFSLRAQDGAISPAPAFLQARPAVVAPVAEAEDAEEKPRKPRRRRAPRAGAEGAAPAETEEA